VVLVHNLPTAVIMTHAAFSYRAVVARSGTIPMDIRARLCRNREGMMNLGFGIAGTISPWIFGILVDMTGSWALPCVGAVGLPHLGGADPDSCVPTRPVRQTEPSCEDPPAERHSAMRASIAGNVRPR